MKAVAPVQAEGASRAALREAARLSRELADGLPALPARLARLAGLLQQGGQVEDSLVVLRRLLTAEPTHLVGQYLAARAQEALGRLPAALETYELLAERVPPWPAPARASARLRLRLGDGPGFREALERYLVRAPGDHGARRAAARSALAARAFGPARDHFQALVAAGVADLRDREGLGHALRGLGRVQEAVAALEAAFSLAPGDARLGLALARLRLERGDAVRARGTCDHLVARHPRLEEAHELAAEAAFRCGDTARAASSLERLLELRPDDLGVRLKLADTLVVLREYEAAREELETLVAKDPGAVEPRLRLAGLALRRHDRPRAKALFRAVLERDPGCPLALLESGRIALEDGELDAASAALRRLVMVRPENPVAHALLGTALRKKGRMKDARVHLERALELDPASIPACLELGQLLAGIGARPAARVAMRRVLELAPGTPEAVRAAYELTHLEAAAPEPRAAAGPTPGSPRARAGSPTDPRPPDAPREPTRLPAFPPVAPSSGVKRIA